MEAARSQKLGPAGHRGAFLPLCEFFFAADILRSSSAAAAVWFFFY